MMVKILNQSEDTLEQDEWPSKVTCNPGLIPIYADILQALGYGSTPFMSPKGKSIARCLNPSLSLELSLIMDACAKLLPQQNVYRRFHNSWSSFLTRDVMRVISRSIGWKVFCWCRNISNKPSAFLHFFLCTELLISTDLCVSHRLLESVISWCGATFPFLFHDVSSLAINDGGWGGKEPDSPLTEPKSLPSRAS